MDGAGQRSRGTRSERAREGGSVRAIVSRRRAFDQTQGVVAEGEGIYRGQGLPTPPHLACKCHLEEEKTCKTLLA